MHDDLVKINFGRDVALLTPVFLNSRNWTVNSLEFPILDVTFNGTKPLRIRLTCDNWSELPPAEEILLADGAPWKGPTAAGSIFNAGPQSQSRGPFICIPGFRGYHTHSGHLADAWSNYRGRDGNNLPGLLDQLSRAWRAAVGV